MTIPHKAWVVVADGSKWLLLVNEGDADYPNLRVIEQAEQDNPPDREIGSDRSGRVQASASPRRGAYDETDFHDQAEQRFAKDLAQHLYTRAHAGDFEALILAAPPAILGVLRQNLHSEVRDRIIAEEAKDLTNHPVKKIEKILSAR